MPTLQEYAQKWGVGTSSAHASGSSAKPSSGSKMTLQDYAKKWENRDAKLVDTNVYNRAIQMVTAKTPYQIALQQANNESEQEKNFANSGLTREEYYQQMQAAATRAGKKATGLNFLYGEDPNAVKSGDRKYVSLTPEGRKAVSRVADLFGRYILDNQNLKEAGAENATFKDYLTGKFVAPTKEQRDAAAQKTEEEMARLQHDRSGFMESLMIDAATANARLAYAEKHRYDDVEAAAKSDTRMLYRALEHVDADAKQAEEEYQNYIRGEKENAEGSLSKTATIFSSLIRGTTANPNTKEINADVLSSLQEGNDAMIEGRSNITGRLVDRREYYPQEGWTWDQRRIHAYLYETDRERADQYAMDVNARLNYAAGKEKAEAIAEDGVTFGEWAGAQGARIASGTDYALNALEYGLEGGVNGSGTAHITNNNQEASLNQIANAVDTAISNNLNGYDPTTGKYTKVLDESIPVIGGKGWGDVYQLGMSMLQSTMAAAGGPATTYSIFFGSAAQNAYEQALERGASQGQALTIGMLNGAAEGLFEVVSIERVKAISDLGKDRATVLKMLRSIGLSGLTEGSEEINTSIADMIIDAAMMADQSETQQLIHSLMAQGMSYDEAWKSAFMSNLNELAYSGLGGFISGVGHSAMFTGLEVANQAMTPYEGDSRQLIEEAQKRGVKGADQYGAHEDVQLSNLQARRLQSGIIKSAGGVKNYVQEKTAQAQNDYNTVRDAVSTLNMDATQEAQLINSFLKGNTSAEAYAEGVKQAFTAGRIGLSLEQAREQFADTRLSRAQFEAAFEIGKNNQTPDIAGMKAKVDGKDYSIRMKGKDTVVFKATDGSIVEMPRTEALTRDGISMPAEAVQLMHAVEQFGENAGEIYNLYTGNLSIESYAAAMNSAIHWAESGVLRQRIESGRTLGQRTNLTRLTEEQIALAEKIGEAARKTQAVSAEARAESLEKKPMPKVRRKGRVVMNGAVTARGEKLKGVNYNDLNKQQQGTVKALQAFANLTGIDYIVYDGIRYGTGAKGSEAEEAWGFYENGKVYVNINAGTGNNFIALATMSHEMVHWMRDFAPKEYAALRDEIVKIYYENDPGRFEDLVQKRMATGGDKGTTLSYDAAVEEIVANSCMEMFQDSDVVDRICADNPGLGQRILDALKQLIKKLFGNINNIDFEENRFYKQYYDAFTNAQDLFAAGIQKAAENAQKGEAATEGRQLMSYKTAEKAGFDALIDQYYKNKLNRNDPVYIGPAEGNAKRLLKSESPLMITAADLNKSTREKGNNINYSAHKMDERFVRTLPSRVNAAEIGYTTDDGKFTYVVFNEYSGKLAAVGGNHNEIYEGNAVDRVKSIYDIGTPEMFLTKEEKNLVFISKEKAEEVLKKARIQSPGLQKILDYGVTISESSPEVNIEDSKTKSTGPSSGEDSRIAGNATDALSENSVAYLVESSNRGMDESVAGIEAAEATERQYSRFVEDEKTLAFLDQQEQEGKVVRTYKSFLKIDGKLYPPMASLQKDENGKYKMAHAMEEGRWEESVGNPKNLIIDEKTGKGYYLLKKDNGKTVKAAYNPYQHSSNLMLNDQFEEAYQRPQLVTYECIIPESELTSGYQAEYAKDPVGLHPWKAGSVASHLKGGTQRNVYLSRWLKPMREVPAAEVAQHYKQLLEGTDVAVPFNVVTPELLQELEKAGVKIDHEGSPMYKARAQRNAAAQETKVDARAYQKYDEETERHINESMTMDQARTMVEKAYRVTNPNEWLDEDEPKFRGAEDWLQRVGADEVAMYIENDYNLQDKYVNGNEYIVNDDFQIVDVIEAYQAGTLTGKQKPKAKRLDTAQRTGYRDSRFYAPQEIQATREMWNTANLKAGGKNKAEVFAARKNILIAAHNGDIAGVLGITAAELNKKLRSWSNYSSKAREFSIRINSGVAEENRWTGIQNSSILSTIAMTDEDIRSMVGSIEGNSSEYQRNYIGQTMLALDTHIDWSWLNFEFRARADAKRSSVRGLYSNADRKIVVGGSGAQNTTAHEMGHALDYQWARDLFQGNERLASNPLSQNSLREDLIPTEEGRQFYRNYRIFIDSLTDVNDNMSSYTQEPTEVFARFIARFVEWTRETAGQYVYKEALSYNDRFTTAQYLEFAKLLQEKAMLDGKRAAEQNAKTSYEGLSADAYYTDGRIYDYDFLVAQKPMNAVVMPKIGEGEGWTNIDRDVAIERGIQNAASVGRPVSDTVSIVKNLYTGRELQISKGAIEHSLGKKGTGRYKTNARIAAVAGETVQNGIPINGLKTEGDPGQITGTYALATLMDGGKDTFVAISTINQVSGDVERFDIIDVTHAISGRIKRDGSAASAAPGSTPVTLISPMSIADFLDVVNETYRSILSDNVLEHYGEERPADGYYSGRTLFQKYSGDDQISMDDMTEGEYSRSAERRLWDPERRKRMEQAEDLTRRVERYLGRFLDEEEMPVLMPRHTDTTQLRKGSWEDVGDIANAEDAILEISNLTKGQMTEGEREEAYRMMEELLLHAGAEARTRYIPDDVGGEEAKAMNRPFLEWYRERHPSLYYEGYTPGDLMNNTENRRREREYLEGLLASDKLALEDRETAEDFLERLNQALISTDRYKEYVSARDSGAPKEELDRLRNEWRNAEKPKERFYMKYDPGLEMTDRERNDSERAADRVQEEKQLLQETLVMLNRELKKLKGKVSGGNEVREDDCRNLAKGYISQFGSTVSIKELSADIKALGDYIVSTDELDDGRIREMARGIADKLIDRAREVEDPYSMRNQDLERHKDAAAMIQGKKFYFPEALRGDLAREGGYTAFRRANMGRFTLNTNTGDSIDALYTELHDMYPDLFPELNTEGDQIIRMAEIFEEAKPDMMNPFDYEDANFVEEVTNQIYEDILGDAVRQKVKDPSIVALVSRAENMTAEDAPALTEDELKAARKTLAGIEKSLTELTKQAEGLEKRWATVSANEELAQKRLDEAQKRIENLSGNLARMLVTDRDNTQARQALETALKQERSRLVKAEELLKKAQENAAEIRQQRDEAIAARQEAEQKQATLQRQLNRQIGKTERLEAKLSENAQRTRERLDELRAEKNERIEQVRKAGIERVRETQAREKAEKWEKVAELREYYREKERNARERRMDVQTRRELRTRITKMYNEFVREITHPTEGRHIPPEMMKQAVDVLQALNMDTSREGTKSGEILREKLAKLKVTYDAVQNDKDFRNAAVYDETVSAMLQAMIEEVGDTPINRMTAKQMESVYNVMTAMRKTARDALKIRMQGEERDAYEVAKKMTGEVRSGQKPNRGLAGAYLNTQLTPERMFNRLGGYHKDSTWSQVYKMLNEGQLESTRIFVEGSRIFEHLLNSKEYDGYVSPKNMVDVGLKDENGNTVMVTHDMLVSLWMHLQNEDNVRHAILGGLTIPNQKQYYNGNRTKGSEEAVSVLGPALPELKRALELREQAQQTEDPEVKREIWREIGELREQAMMHAETLRKAVSSQMTTYDRQWAAALTELFDVYSKEQLNRTTLEVYGIKRASVEHYWPINVDGDFLNTPFESVAKDFSIENAGFMKERVSSTKPIRLVGSSDVASSQLKKVSQYSGLMPVIRSFNKIWGKTQIGYQDSLRKAVHQVYGDTGVKYIENLMADLNGARSSQESPFGQTLNKLRGNMAQAALTLSMRTAFGQTASYPTAAAVVGWKPLMQALAKGGKDGRMISRADTELIERYSPLLRYRMMGFSTTELGDISTSNSRMARIWKKARWLTGWIQAMDGATVGRLWYAAEYYVDDHNKSLQKGTDAYYEEVAKVFNDIVEKTQPDYTTMQRPDILRNPNVLVRSLTMFMTQRLQNANIMYDAAATLSQMKKDYAAGTYGVTKEDVQQAAVNTKRAASSLIVASVTITAFKFLADVVQHSMNAYRDKDKDLTEESVGTALLDMFLDSMISNLLAGSEVYRLVESKVFGKTYYGIEVSGISTVSDVAEDLSNLFDKIRESGFKVGEYTSEINKSAKDIAQLLGLPLSNGEKIVMGIINHGKDIANGEFGSFEAGVERKTSQNGHRLYRAYVEGDKAKVQKIREEAGEDQGALNQSIAGYIKDLYREGELTEEETKKQLMEYAEVGKFTAADAIGAINFEKDFGFKFDDIRDHYLEGSMTAKEAVNALVKYGNRKESSAQETVEYWKEKYDFDKRYGTDYERYDLTFAGAKQYYKNFRNQATLEEFADQWKSFGANIVKNYYNNGWKQTGLTVEEYAKNAADTPIYGDAKAQAAFKVWSQRLKPAGMSLSRFTAFLDAADADGNDSLKQDELGAALLSAIASYELSQEDAEALWNTQGWKSSFTTWSKKKKKRK